jgi:hypothetical protein
MFFLDNDKLTLVHYCDAGNRPRMTGAVDGDKAQFQLVDVSGAMTYGHMHGAAFSFVDADHHSEEWTYMTPQGKPVLAHIDLTRKK